MLTDPTYHFEPFRRAFLHVPSAPHCKLCGAPFKGVGGFIFRPFGFRPWEKNPSLCNVCMTHIQKLPASGAEIECTLLFADVRSSTGLAEQSTASDYARVLRRFYAVGSAAVIAQNGIVDKFVGDEIMAIFVPALSRPSHALAGIRAARRLLSETGHGQPSGPWLQIGIGVHTGIAFVGSLEVGSRVTDFTALGDTVNAAARLASEAAAGTVLVSEAARESAGIRLDAVEMRELTLRGREAPLQVRAADYGTLVAADV